MVSAYLGACGFRVQEARVRESLERVDGVGVAVRWSQNRIIHRRVYNVPYPNALRHIDGNMSLSRWGFVVHAGVDRYSCMVTYLHCSTNNRAGTIVHHFLEAGEIYGFPSRLQSDCGGENFQVAEFMLLLRGLNQGSHITGRSTRNQRIEQLWQDVFENCLLLYYNLCELQLHALQHVYQPRINNSLDDFQVAWNNRPLSSPSSLTPLQLWTAGMLENRGTNHQPIQEMFSAAVIADFTDQESENSEGTSAESVHFEELRRHVNPMQPSEVWGIDLYTHALEVALQNE